MSSGLADSAFPYPQLVGDIGGTNARFARIEAPGAALTQIETIPTDGFPGPAEAVDHYLARAGGARPLAAAFGIANPIAGDEIRMTNSDWAFSIEAVRKQLGLAHLRFINDFTALALSLPLLGEEDRIAVGGGTAVPGAAIGVIGPGTGLGVSGLIPDRLGGGYSPIEGEGGHVTLAGQSPEEWAVIEVLSRTFPHVSAERVLSGIGIPSLHKALAEVRGQRIVSEEPAEITRAGLEHGDPLACATLNTFCALLGTVAANLALTLGARGGLYIGGGIVPKLGDFFVRSPFRQRFEEKGRFSAYLAAIPTWVITAKYAALLGASSALRRS